jgi:hypothetical protein
MFGPKEENLPTIHALKEKLNAMKVSELNFQSKKKLISMKNRPKLLAHELSKKSLPNTKSFKR